MTTTWQVIRWSTAGAVAGVAAVAAVASYEPPSALVRAHGETGWIGRLVPLTVDGLIYAGSMVLLDSARREVPVPALARGLLGLGIAATLGGKWAAGHLSQAIPAVAPLRVQAAEVFAADVAAGRLPSIRVIRSRLRVGQPRA